MSSEDQKSAPSMLAGHAKYVQGAVSDMLGYETGKETKDQGFQEMKDAKQVSDSQPAQSGILGSIESTAGKAVGCDGMVDEGNARKPVSGAEEASGTG